jgi:hypothetical protein
MLLRDGDGVAWTWLDSPRLACCQAAFLTNSNDFDRDGPHHCEHPRRVDGELIELQRLTHELLDHLTAMFPLEEAAELLWAMADGPSNYEMELSEAPLTAIAGGASQIGVVAGAALLIP